MYTYMLTDIYVRKYIFNPSDTRSSYKLVKITKKIECKNLNQYRRPPFISLLILPISFIRNRQREIIFSKSISVAGFIM